MAVKKSEVTFKQVGRNLNVVIDGEVITRTGNKEELTPIRELAKLVKEKPTKANIAKLVKALKPQTEAKEKKKEEIKTQVKVAKRKAKETKAKITKTNFSNIKDTLSDVTLTAEQKKELLALLEVEEKAKSPEPKAKTRRRGEW